MFNYNQFHFIYLLVDPTTEKPFYLGKSRNPIQRFGAHLAGYGRDGSNLGLYVHLEKLRESLILPKLQIIAYCHPNEIDEAEKNLIAVYNNLYPLLNRALNKDRDKYYFTKSIQRGKLKGEGPKTYKEALVKRKEKRHNYSQTLEILI